MSLANQACPGMYTPVEKPLISSYKFGMPRIPDEGQLKKLFPCLTAYIGEYDGTQNYWQTKCPWCRNQCKYQEKKNTKTLHERMVWLHQNFLAKAYELLQVAVFLR